MELEDVSRLTARLDGVVERRRDGLLDWRYRGRLVARQLDATSLVIRAPFEFRAFLLESRSPRRSPCRRGSRST